MKASKAADADKAELLDNSVRWDLDHGVIEMRASRLDIERINYPLANLKFQTAGVRVRGLHLHLEYPDSESKRNTTTLRLRIDQIDLSDVMLIRPDSMMGFEQILASELHIDMLPEGAAAPLAAPSDDIAAGTILLTPMYNLLKISGFNLPLIGTEVTHSRIGTLSKGLFEATTPLNLTVTVGNLQLKGLTTSSGQFIGGINLSDLAVRTRTRAGKGRYRAALLEEQERLQRKIPEVRAAETGPAGPRRRHHVTFDTAASLGRELKSVEKELANLEEAEAYLRAFEEKAKAGRQTEAEQHRAERLRNYLAGVDEGGLALSIGHVEAKNFAGKVSMGDVNLDDVQGYGQSPGAVLGTLLSSTTVNRMLRGPEYRGTIAGVELEGDPLAFVKLGQIEVKALNVQGDIPTPEQAQKDFDEAEKQAALNPFDPRLADERERLRKRHDNAVIYWSILRQQVVGSTERDAFNRARQELLEDSALRVESFRAKDATLELTHDAAGTTRAGLDAGQLEVNRLETRGVKVQQITGSNVRVGAGVTGGLDALIGLGKNRRALQGGAISADTLRAAGIVHKHSGVSVEEVVVDALRASATVKDGDSLVRLGARAITVKGVNWALSARLLTYQRDKLLAKPEDQRTGGEKAQLADIETLLETLKTTQETLEETVKRLTDPKISSDEKTRLEEQKAAAEEQLAFWQRKVELKRLTISDLNLDIEGLGDVLAEDYDFNQAVKRGITVSGGGLNRQILTSAKAEGAWMRLSAGGTKDLPNDRGMQITAGSQVRATEISVGPVRGAITYAADHVAIRGFWIESLGVRDLRYAGGNSMIWAKGASQLAEISITARLDTPLVDEDAPDGDRYVSGLHIDTFEIGKVRGEDVRYRNYESGLQVTLNGGSLAGIYAKGVDVDFAKTEYDSLLIRGGTAGFARAEGLRATASTGSGLALAGALSTGSLLARFAQDGAIIADLHEISGEGHLTQKDLDARFNARARNLHLELLPGAKGYQDATQRLRLQGATIGVEGKKGIVSATGAGPDPTRFAGGVKDLDTGDVIRTPDGTVRAPNFSVMEIALNQLHLDTGKMRIDVPKGSNILLTAVTADVTAEANPKPEAQRGPDESAFSRIVVHDFYVPIVTLDAITIEMRDPDKGSLILSLPAGYAGTIRELRLGASEKSPDGFVIKPNEAWQMFGKFGFDQASLHGIGADLRSALVTSVDAEIKNFSVGFVGAEDTVIAFDELVAMHLQGRLKEPGTETYSSGAGTDDVIVSKLKRAGFSLTWTKSGVESKVRLKGFKSSKAGTTLQELEISGLRYEDPDQGFTLDIRRAILPEGKDGKPALEFTPAGKLIVPMAEINDADFYIRDVLALGKGGGKKSTASDSGLTFAPDLSLVDMLSGHVYFTVTPYARGAAGMGIYLAGPFNIKVDIRSGKIDFKELEDKSTGNLADFAVDLDFEEGGFDWSVQKVLPARLQISIIAIDPYWWDLDEKESALARTGFVNVSTFLKHPLRTIPSTSTTPTKKSFLTNFFFGNLDLHLELPSKSEIKLGNAGSLVLGGDAGPGFVIEATSEKLPAIKAAIPKLSANIASLDLKLDTLGTRLKTGEIAIEGMSGGEIRFETQGVGPVYTDDDGNKTQNELPMPTTLQGVITKATMKNLELQTV